MPVIRSISGLRATFGSELTPQLILKYASALHQIMPNGEIVIGRDGRPSGVWIENILSASLASFGRVVRVLGIVPTPTVQIETEHSDAVAAIAITASHNPAQWNGMKFIASDGVFFDAQMNQKLWEFVDSSQYSDTVISFKEPIHDSNSIQRHIDKILDISIFKNSNSLEQIKSSKFKVVVDAVNASGSKAVPMLLRKLNCEVVELFCDSSGIFPHTPEPLPENLSTLGSTVADSKADIGIAVDPDADRLVLIDEQGNSIGEEKTIALAVLSYLSSGAIHSHGDTLAVINHSSSMMTERIAEQFGGKCVRSAVGEINVINKMRLVKAVIGGEGSGGVILPECHYGRDSLVGIALVLNLMATSGKSLSQLSSELPNYIIRKTKFPFDGNFEDFVIKLSNQFYDMNINTEDGIKFLGNDSWVQARKSNTEPIIRIIAEARTEETALALISKLRSSFN